MDGIGRVRETEGGKQVIGITIDTGDLELLLNTAKRAGHTKVTFDVNAEPFKAKTSGLMFHNYVARHWEPKVVADKAKK